MWTCDDHTGADTGSIETAEACAYIDVFNCKGTTSCHSRSGPHAENYQVTVWNLFVNRICGAISIWVEPSPPIKEKPMPSWRNTRQSTDFALTKRKGIASDSWNPRWNHRLQAKVVCCLAERGAWWGHPPDVYQRRPRARRYTPNLSQSPPQRPDPAPHGVDQWRISGHLAEEDRPGPSWWLHGIWPCREGRPDYQSIWHRPPDCRWEDLSKGFLPFRLH